MTTLFQLPVWRELKPFARAAMYSTRHNQIRIEFKPPSELLVVALNVVTNCVSCGASVNPIRSRRVRSDKSRIAGTATVKHAFYASTCPSDVNPSCQRTKAAKAHMQGVAIMFGLNVSKPDRLKLEAYRALCDQVRDALMVRDDKSLASWFKRRCSAIEG